MKIWILSFFGLGIFSLFLFWLFKPSSDAPLTSQVLSESRKSQDAPLEQSQKVKVIDYTLPTYDGESINLAQVNSEKPVVIQIWATWCHICDREFPENNLLAQKYKDKIEYHAVSIGGSDQTPQAIEKYVQRKNLDPKTIKFLVDIKGEVSGKYGFYSTPQHLFVEKGGDITFYKGGYMAPTELETQIQKLIQS